MVNILLDRLGQRNGKRCEETEGGLYGVKRLMDVPLDLPVRIPNGSDRIPMGSNYVISILITYLRG